MNLCALRMAQVELNASKPLSSQRIAAPFHNAWRPRHSLWKRGSPGARIRSFSCRFSLRRGFDEGIAMDVDKARVDGAGAERVMLQAGDEKVSVVTRPLDLDGA